MALVLAFLHMDICVRCFLLDDEDRILLVKHGKKQMRVLPWGHMEEGDSTVYDTLRREIKEELGITIAIIWVENSLEHKGVRAYPLPVSMHTVRYEHKTRGMIEKFEYIFFARAEGDIQESEEIEAVKWLEMEEILALEDDEVPAFIKQILDQNSELLEVIG